MSWLRKPKETEHQYFEKQLSAYLDGELLPGERAAVEQHLAICPSCRWNLKTLRQTAQWTSELPMVRIPRTFTIPVPAQPAPAARKWRLVPVLQGATALVALLLFFVVAGDAMLTGFQPVSMLRPAPQVVAVTATMPVLEEGAEPTAERVVETVVVEKEAETVMMLEAPVAEESATEEPAMAEESVAVEASAETLEEAPAQATAVVEMRATVTPAGAGEMVGDAREDVTAVAGGAAPTASPPEPSLALQASPLPPTVTVMATAAPTLEPAPTAVAVAPPSAQKEEGEALAAPGPEPDSESRHDLKPAVLRGVRWMEYVLGVLLIVLVGTTVGAVVWRRGRR
jgi:hypothetical protein